MHYRVYFQEQKPTSLKNGKTKTTNWMDLHITNSKEKFKGDSPKGWLLLSAAKKKKKKKNNGVSSTNK